MNNFKDIKNNIIYTAIVISILVFIYSIIAGIFELSEHPKNTQIHFVPGEKELVIEHIENDDLIKQAKELENIRTQLDILTKQMYDYKVDLEEIKKILYRLDKNSNKGE